MTENLTAFKDLIIEYLKANDVEHQYLDKADGESGIIFIPNGYEILMIEDQGVPIMQLTKTTVQLLGGAKRLLAATEIIRTNLLSS